MVASGAAVDEVAASGAATEFVRMDDFFRMEVAAAVAVVAGAKVFVVVGGWKLESFRIP